MASTYEAIATTTLTGTQATITFSSIPQTYTDLRLILTFTQNTSSDCKIRYNNTLGTGYSWTYLVSYGTGNASSRSTGMNYIEIGGAYTTSSTTIPGFVSIDIFNYTNTSIYKSSRSTYCNDKNGSGDITTYQGLWQNTSAITQIDLGQFSSALFNSGTVATLYGIKAA